MRFSNEHSRHNIDLFFYFQVLILKDKLLGVLVHFDNYLNNESIPIRTKREVFASLMSLMRLMGPARITEVRLRLMTTLK